MSLDRHSSFACFSAYSHEVTASNKLYYFTHLAENAEYATQT